MVNPHTFAIHRTFPYRVCTQSELICTKRWNVLHVHHLNNSALSVYFVCMWFVSYRYSFLAFNASVLYFQTVRPLLQLGRCSYLVPSLRQVVQGLEEVEDQDHSWRAELMMQVTPKCSLTCLSSISPVSVLSSLMLMIHNDIQSQLTTSSLSSFRSREYVLGSNLSCFIAFSYDTSGSNGSYLCSVGIMHHPCTVYCQRCS